MRADARGLDEGDTGDAWVIDSFVDERGDERPDGVGVVSMGEVRVCHRLSEPGGDLAVEADHDRFLVRVQPVEAVGPDPGGLAEPFDRGGGVAPGAEQLERRVEEEAAPFGLALLFVRVRGSGVDVVWEPGAGVVHRTDPTQPA